MDIECLGELFGPVEEEPALLVLHKILDWDELCIEEEELAGVEHLCPGQY